MRKVIIGALAGLGLLLAGGCNPPKSATPDRVLGPSQATLNTFPSLMKSASARRAEAASMKGTGGSGQAGRRAAGPTEPLRDTGVDASQVNYANQGTVVGGAANATDAYSTGENKSVGGGGIAPQRGAANSAQAGTIGGPGQVEQRPGKSNLSAGQQPGAKQRHRAKQHTPK